MEIFTKNAEHLFAATVEKAHTCAHSIILCADLVDNTDCVAIVGISFVSNVPESTPNTPTFPTLPVTIAARDSVMHQAVANI